MSVLTTNCKKTVNYCINLDLDSPAFYLLVTVFVVSVVILPFALVPVTLFIYTNLG